jgi:hypothetical protein
LPISASSTSQQSPVYLARTRQFVNFFTHSKPVGNADLGIGLAVRYTMQHCAFPWDMTTGSEFALLKATKLMLKNQETSLTLQDFRFSRQCC